MKITFHFRDEFDDLIKKNGKSINPSNSFLLEMKRQVLNTIVSNIEAFFPSNSILIEYSSQVEWFQEEGVWVGSFKDVAVIFVKAFKLFYFDVLWKSSKGCHKVIPTDKVEEELIFWTKGVMSKQAIEKESIALEKYIVSFKNRTNSVVKRYKFPFIIKSRGEMATFSIYSVESVRNLDYVLSEFIDEWNTSQEKGIVHNYEFFKDKSSGNKKTFIINWGSSDDSVVDFILSKLDKSNISIEKVILDSL